MRNHDTVVMVDNKYAYRELILIVCLREEIERLAF